MKTCFVISPIGMDGSEIRKNADDLFELIIEPALEKYSFKVIRGDMGSSASSITEEVISLIQNSELCIIDLTGHNPNVFYECGRRHETTKPFILIKRLGEEAPFDLKDIRTLDYDLSDPRKTRTSIDKLRKFVDALEEMDNESESPVISLATIANALDRIEKKIDTINIVPQGNGQVAESSPVVGSPSHVFYNSMQLNDTATAVKALKRFMQISTDVNRHLDMASMLVEAYEPAGVPIVNALIEKNFDTLDAAKLALALHGLYTYYVGALTIEKEYDNLRTLTEKALQKPNLTEKDEAAFYNLLASLEYSMQHDNDALKYQEKAIDKAPTEPAYYYNVARIYQVLDNKDELITSLNALVAIYKEKDAKNEKINVDYLQYAKDILQRNNLKDKVAEIDALIANGYKTA